MARLSVASSIPDPRRAGSSRPAFAAFVNDAETEAIIRRAFPQKTEEPESVQRGGISKAIEHLSNHRSPDLLLADISNIELPLTKIRQLSEVCEPGVQVIAIGNRNEIGLYRDLVHAGVADYIVKPLTIELLTRAIALVSNPDAAVPTQKVGKVVTVLGARGGVGATTIAVSLAWHLANRAGRRVAFVDLDLQTGDSSLMLDIKATSALREALENASRIDHLYLERVMVPHGERLFVLNAEEPLNDEMQFSPDAVAKLITTLQADFHYVVLDVPRTPSLAHKRALELASQRIIVADETIRSAREIVRLRGVLDQGKTSSSRNLLVINRAGERRPGYIPQKDFLTTIEMPAAVTIPLVAKTRSGPADYGGPAAAHRGPIATAIETLAGEISGRPMRQRKWWAVWQS
jgi:pilus assembly protein CpaE